MPDGPIIGGCNLKKLSRNILDAIQKSQLLDIRGARNYEMLQGLNKDVYFGFIVCREISESLTGLFSSKTFLLFISTNQKVKNHSTVLKSVIKELKEGRC